MNLMSKYACALGLFLSMGSGVAQAGYTTLYSDTTTFSGYGYAAGSGAATVGGSLTSRTIADDITVGTGLSGSTVNTVFFAIYSGNAVAVSASPELFFYANSTAGTPGTLLGALAFNPISFTAGASATYSFTSATGLFNVPTNGQFWAGISFTDAFGGTATAAQLNQLGMGIFNPVAVGSSHDYFYQTTAASSNDTSNPAGSLLYFGGNPAANFGWEFDGTPAVVPVPEPSSLGLLAMAATIVAGGRALNRKRRVVA